MAAEATGLLGPIEPTSDGRLNVPLRHRYDNRELHSQRNGEQRIEMTAVADHQALGKAQAAGFIANPVKINASDEQIRASIAHDACDQERPDRSGR